MHINLFTCRKQFLCLRQDIVIILLLFLSLLIQGKLFFLIIFGHVFIYLFFRSPLTLILFLAHLPSTFTSACSRLVCLPVFTVSNPVSLNLNHSQQLIHSSSRIHCTAHPLQSYPFTVRAVPQADTEITVKVHY